MSLSPLEFNVVLEVQVDQGPEFTPEQMRRLIAEHPEFEERFCSAMSHMVHELLTPPGEASNIFSVGTTVTFKE